MVQEKDFQGRQHAYQAQTTGSRGALTRSGLKSTPHAHQSSFFSHSYDNHQAEQKGDASRHVLDNAVQNYHLAAEKLLGGPTGTEEAGQVVVGEYLQGCGPA